MSWPPTATVWRCSPVAPTASNRLPKIWARARSPSRPTLPTAIRSSKWGINGFSEGLRQELAPDVRVIVIEPGAVATELTDHITDANTRQIAKEFVGDIAISAQDIAETIAFAVSRPPRMTLNEILVRPSAQTR